VSADDFAHTLDVHCWLGTIGAADCRRHDRVVSRDEAAERLARVVCADRSMLDDAGITAIATRVAQAQVDALTDAMRRVRARHPQLTQAVVLGLGTPIARAAATAAGLGIVEPGPAWTSDTSRAAPAVAVARLLELQRA
jgi:uncharacterized hydantoinase/oxoprolinase family protein